MKEIPKAIEGFEQEKRTMDESMSAFFEHPIDRLKYHIKQTGGKILKSEFSIDGRAYVTWQGEGKEYRAWSTWPDQGYQINWKPLK